MAIIYSYTPATNLSGDDLLVVSKKEQDFCTKSVTLSKLVEFINGQPQGGVGTTNSIVKFTDGPGGLIGDSIMNEDIDKINLNGTLSISETNNQKLEIKFGTDSSLTHDNVPGVNDNLIIGRAGDLIIRNRARTRDIVFEADNGEFDGNIATYFRLDGSMADIGNPDLYTRWGDNSRIVLGNSANATNLDFEMYYDGSDTYLLNGQSFLNVESKGGIFIENKTSSGIDIINSAAGGDIGIQATDDIKLQGGTGEFFRIDTGEDKSVAYKDIRYRDNIKALFGNSDDLQIYHDGANSIIEDVGTGDLNISGALAVTISGGGVQTASFSPAGFVATFGGTNKISTSSTGIDLDQDGDGIKLKSPNGTVYLLTVDNAGNLVVT